MSPVPALSRVPLLLPAPLLSFHCTGCLVCCHRPWTVFLVPEERVCLEKVLQLAGPEGRDLAAALDSRLRRSYRSSGPDDRQILVVRQQVDGRCLFLRDDGRCAIQHHAGLAAMPPTCRDYPRAAVATPAGIQIRFRLSCPTAARLAATAAEPYRLVSWPHQRSWPYGHDAPCSDLLQAAWDERGTVMGWDAFSRFRSAALGLIADEQHPSESLLAGIVELVEGHDWAEAERLLPALGPREPAIVERRLHEMGARLAVPQLIQYSSRLVGCLPDPLVDGRELPSFWEGLERWPTEAAEDQGWSRSLRQAHGRALRFLAADGLAGLLVFYGRNVREGVRQVLQALALFLRIAGALAGVRGELADPRVGEHALALTEFLLQPSLRSW